MFNSPQHLKLEDILALKIKEGSVVELYIAVLLEKHNDADLMSMNESQWDKVQELANKYKLPGFEVAKAAALSSGSNSNNNDNQNSSTTSKPTRPPI